jgi:ATP-binding cassette subfamily C protein CydC
MKPEFRLRDLFARRLGWMLGGLALMLLSLTAGLALLALSGWFITASALAGLGLIAALDIFTPGAGIRLAAVTRTVSRYGERLVTHEATLRLLSDLRGRVLGALLTQDELQLKQLRRGDTLSRLTRDVDTLDHLFLGVAAPSGAALLLTLLALTLLTLIDPPLALLTAGLLVVVNPLVALATWASGRKASAVSAQTLPRLRALTTEGIEGLDELRALDRTRHYGARLDRVSNRLVTTQEKAATVDAIGQALVGLTGNMAVWLGLLLGLGLHAAGAISAPVLGLLVLALIGLNEAWLPLPAAWRRLAECVAAARRVRDLTHARSKLPVEPNPRPWPDSSAIELSQIEFSWRPDYPKVFDRLDLRVDNRETVAVVGPSGVGKSTLALLIRRQIDPQSGRACIGGEDLRRLDGDELRRRIAYLEQRPVLFSDTLAANLRLARPDADDQALAEALEHVRLRDFVASLPNGLNTWIDEAGANVSGGQLRRIALARLLLTDPDIVILDEPTASLDAATAAAIMDRMTAWMAERTALVITHDESIVPEDCRVIRLGKP